MKKLTALALALICLLALPGCSGAGKRPYKDLKAEEISSAVIFLQPPDKTVQVKDMDRLAALLRDLVIYEKDNSYTQYAGQSVTIRLTMSDGTRTSITECNPFLIIDGTGYRTKYEPCEALNHWANGLSG